jgi:hypothetical protein
MEKHTTQQEVLLFTGTSFSAGNWSRREDAPQNEDRSQQDRLEAACWNGLVQELLPEVFEQPAPGKKIFLWQIREGDSFIDLELGEYPVTIDSHFSIDPYAWLATKPYN